MPESLLIPIGILVEQYTTSGTASKQIFKMHSQILSQRCGFDPETAPPTKEAGTTHRILEGMRQMSGLIVERGYDAFGFLHLHIQEYLQGAPC